MKVDTQRLIDRYVGTVICRFFSAIDRLRPRQQEPTDIKKILIVFLSEMGSLTLAWPMIQRLKEKYPGVSLSILTFERNREIIEILGYVDPEQIVVINDASFARLTADSLRAIFRIRRFAPDAVIDGELFSRISSIYSFLSGAPIKVGFYRYTQEGLYRGSYFNRPVLYNPYYHISRQFINLVESLADGETPKNKRLVSDNELPLPVISILPQEQDVMRERIKGRAADVLSRPLIVLHPGGGLLEIRAWPPAYYCSVAKSLVAAGFSVIITGPDEDRPLAQTIVNGCSSSFCLDMTGVTTSIRELLVVFSLSVLLITNDGGPGHFAGLTATPSIILYGPETPQLYGSLNKNAINLSAECTCAPCLTAYNHRRSPCNGNNVCLKAIRPETVLEHAFQLLRLEQ